MILEGWHILKDFDGSDMEIIMRDEMLIEGKLIPAIKKPAIISTCIIDSLRNNAGEPAGCSGEEHVKRDILAEEIYKASKKREPLHLMAEDMELIKDRVKKQFRTLISGRLLRLLLAIEKADKPENTEKK